MIHELPQTELERDRMEDCGRLAAFIEELDSLFYEGYAEDLQRDEKEFTEKFREFVNR